MENTQCPCESCQRRFDLIEEKISSNSSNYFSLNTEISIIKVKVENIENILKEIKQKVDNSAKSENEEYRKIKAQIVTTIVTAIVTFLIAKLLP